MILRPWPCTKQTYLRASTQAADGEVGLAHCAWPLAYLYMYIYIYVYVHTYIYTHIFFCLIPYSFGCGLKPVLSRGPLLFQAFVASPLLQILVADLCVECCSLQGPCRGGVCRRTPPSVTNLCREKAAQACYKANVFDSLPLLISGYPFKSPQSFACQPVMSELRALFGNPVHMTLWKYSSFCPKAPLGSTRWPRYPSP